MARPRSPESPFEITPTGFSMPAFVSRCTTNPLVITGPAISKNPKFPDFWESVLSVSDMSGSGGNPVAGEHEGKAAPLERGRGKNSPPAKLKRVTARASARKGKILDFFFGKNPI